MSMDASIVNVELAKYIKKICLYKANVKTPSL